jgi:hypothetical protein
VRESAVLVDVMTAARNQMRMKQIGERQSPTEKRIIGKQVLQIPCYPRAAEATVLSVTAIAIAIEIEIEISISTSHTAVDATRQ